MKPTKGTLRTLRWMMSEIQLIVGTKRTPRRSPTTGLGSTNDGLEKKSTSTPLSTRVRKSSALAAAILPACSDKNPVHAIFIYSFSACKLFYCRARFTRAEYYLSYFNGGCVCS